MPELFPSAFRIPTLLQTRPNLPPATTPRPLTQDTNNEPNSARAAGASLINSTLADTSQLNGMGGKIGLMV